MLKYLKSSVTATLLLGVSALAAQAEDLVIFQNWSSPAEVAAPGLAELRRRGAVLVDRGGVDDE